MRPSTPFLAKPRLRCAQRDICLCHNARFEDDGLEFSSLRTVVKTPDIITGASVCSWLVRWWLNKMIALHLLQMTSG